MNKEEKETWEALQSYADNLKWERLADGTIVFDGEGVDGPVCGYIDKTGKVSWVSAG